VEEDEVSFEVWAAELRADEAIEERRRRAVQRQLALNETTLAGVLQGVAAREQTVTINVRSGGAASGTITASGADFVVLDSAVLVMLEAISELRSPESLPIGSDSSVTHRASALAWLADQLEGATMCSLRNASGEVRHGRLVGCTADSVVLDGPAGTSLLPIRAVELIELHR
jgi:hypothetical protein